MNLERFSVTAAKVREWAHARNLINGSGPKDQLCKLVSEAGEISEGYRDLDQDALSDAIGDTTVVLTIITAQLGYDIETVCEANESLGKAMVKRDSSVDVLLDFQVLLGLYADNIGKNQKVESLANAALMVVALDRIAEDALLGDINGSFDFAYNEIKDRKGVMYNGVFIKDSDPRYHEVVLAVNSNVRMAKVAGAA